MIQKQELPMPRQITFETNSRKLQDMVDNAINRALINQSSVLSNTIFHTMAKTFKEGQAPLYMLAQPMISMGCHWLQLHRRLWPLQVQKLLLLQAH